MKNIIIILILLLIGINLKAQPFVVSEYLDAGGDPSGEWTEILVIQDMVSIVGYSLRDNAESGSWQPAVTFKDIPLWKNLREGTIIVVNHRNGDIDTDKSDGYIEVGASSSLFFDNPLASDASSLRLNGNHDMVQILDPSGNNVHTLAHLLPTREGDVFASINGPKVGTPNVAFRSVHVYPGEALNQYSGGLNNALAITTGQATKGKPNDNSNSTNTNHLFWRTLREPSWSNPPNLQSSITPDYKGIKLEWAPASSISDKNEGYIIVRYINNGNQPLTLVDGKIYGPGDVVAPYTIVDTIPDLTSTTYIDTFKHGTFNCGEKYSYRIYIYRYQKSNVDPQVHDVSPLYGRGRAYNETDYGSTFKPVEKEIPPAPVLSTLGNRTEFCTNEIAEIISDIKDKNKYQFTWYFDNNNMGIDDFKIIADKSGNYKLVIKNILSGCTDSNSISLTFIQAPETFIRNRDDNKTFNNDTIIEVCGFKEFNLQGIYTPPGNTTYFWLKNGAKFNDNINTLKITESGVYKFVAIANGLCPDTSITIDVRYAQPDFTVTPTTLSFDFDASPEQDFTINNDSDKELIIGPANISINPSGNFIIIDPIITNQNPLIIGPKSSEVLKIRFQTTDYNTKNATLTINVCDSIRTIGLTGIRKNSGRSVLQADPPTGIDFGTIIYKCDEMYTKKINVIVNGPKPLKTKLQSLTKNLFTATSNTLLTDTEVNLTENSIHEITVSVNSTLPSGNYNDEIVVIFKNDLDALFDTLRIPIRANIINPKFFPDTIKFDFSDLPTCINVIDTSFRLDVVPGYEFEISNNFADPQLSYAETLPLTLRNDGKNIIYIKFNFTSTDDIDTFIELSPCGKQIPIKIIPPKRDLEIKYIDTIDFGIINNAEFCGDFVLDFLINTSHPVTVEFIEYMSPNLLVGIEEGMKFKGGDSLISAVFPLQDVGVYLDSAVFYLKECNKKIVIYMKGERIDSKLIRLADEIIDFGTDYVGVSEIFTTKLYNFSKTEILELRSIDVPNPFILFNPNNNAFPLIVQPLDSIELEFQYQRSDANIYKDSISVNMKLPCERTLKYEIKGAAIDRKDYSLRYNMPDNFDAMLNQVFALPIELDMSDNFDQTDASIDNIKLYFSYDRAIFDIKSIKPISNSIILNNSDFQAGNIILDYKLSETSNLQNGPLFELEIKPLLGHTLKSEINLDSVIYIAKTEIETPSDNTLITINGDCFIQYRTVEVGGESNLILKGNNPVGNLIDVDFSIVSDEISKLTLFDINGNAVRNLVNEQLKPGTYNVNLSTSNLNSGAYYLILNNGINTETIKLNIVK